MAEKQAPNDTSRKSQAEGDRPGGKDEQAGGITNRPLDEEQRNQEAVPERGDAKPGAHAGHGEHASERDKPR